MSMTSGATADHLYVVGEDEQSSIVKVGRSGRPAARLTSIQTGYPRKLRLLHVEEGAGNLEDEVHKALAARRISGEWFDFGDKAALETVRQCIADLKTIQEIASRNAVTVSLFPTYVPPPASIVDVGPGESPAAERRPRRKLAPPIQRDPCEFTAMQQVVNSSVTGFFATHPDPVRYLRDQGIPAHHVALYMRDFPRMCPAPDDDLLAAAAQELAEPETLTYQVGSFPACRLAERQRAS